MPAQVVTGKWYGLAAIYESQRQEFDWWQQQVEAAGGLACPVCGEPISNGGGSRADGDTQFYCRFAGDHSYHVPDDVIRPQRGAKMGRFG